MENAGFTNALVNNNNTNVNAQNGQVNIDAMKMQAEQSMKTSIFSKSNKGNADVNQSNSNSGGTGGLGNIFAGGGFTQPSTFDNTSIFAGIQRGNNYALYSNRDYNYTIPKLTQDDIANQKAAEGEKRTNPKAYNIDMTPKANPYEAFRNPEMRENKSLSQTFGNAFANLLGQKKAN